MNKIITDIFKEIKVLLSLKNISSGDQKTFIVIYLSIENK